MAEGTSAAANWKIYVLQRNINVTGTGLNGSDRVRMCNRFPRFLLIIVVQHLPLCMTGRSMDTGCDVIKRHVTPKGYPWKGGVRARHV
jgi:hypothetical protein